MALKNLRYEWVPDGKSNVTFSDFSEFLIELFSSRGI